jgi:hypothetical protein
MLLHGHVKAWLSIEQICDEGWRRGIPFHIIKSVTFLDRQQLVAMHVGVSEGLGWQFFDPLETKNQEQLQ